MWFFAFSRHEYAWKISTYEIRPNFPYYIFDFSIGHWFFLKLTNVQTFPKLIISRHIYAHVGTLKNFALHSYHIYACNRTKIVACGRYTHIRDLNYLDSRADSHAWKISIDEQCSRKQSPADTWRTSSGRIIFC